MIERFVCITPPTPPKEFDELGERERHIRLASLPVEE
jgi:hypothetical protein